MNLPNILIINDGNRRWAKERNLSIEDGYHEMANKIAFICDELHGRGYKKVYFACCTVANLSREKDTVDAYFREYLRVSTLTKIKIKVVLHGNLELIPDNFKSDYANLEKSTSENDDFTLHYLINWSIEDELVRVFNKLNGKYEKIDWEIMSKNSDITEPVDLIIRTGKRNRLSSCFPFNSSFAEIAFLDILFPDITREDIEKVLKSYEPKMRTFGK